MNRWKFCRGISGNEWNYAYPLHTHHHKANVNYAVFCILIIVGEDTDEIIYHRFPPIPYDVYPDLRGVRQVIATNLGVLIPLSCIQMPAYIFCVGDVMSEHPPPLLKGAVNAYFVSKIILFPIDSHNIVVNGLLFSHGTTHLAIGAPPLHY